MERDIVAISIPFSAGVCLAAIMPASGLSYHLGSCISCLASAALLAISCGRGKRVLFIIAMFFSTGFFCFCSRALLPSFHSPSFGTDAALQKFTAAIASCDFPHESTSALIKALLAGAREDLDRETINTFRAAGAAHILALSGLHLGVIYGILSKCLFWTGKSRAGTAFRGIVTVIASGFFVKMTGSSPSTARAFLFILLNEIAREQPGRRRRPLSVFSAAIIVQLAIDPMVILSAGFQLSYLAICGLVILYPRLREWYPGNSRLDLGYRLWNATSMTVSCQLFTAPVVWLHFHTFPKYFLLANLIALPLTEIVIICAVVTVTLSSAGWCPEIIKNLTDYLSQIMLYSLKVIAAIS